MNFSSIEELIELDKELLDFTLCMALATKYKTYNSSYHALVRQKAEEEIKELKKLLQEKNTLPTAK